MPLYVYVCPRCQHRFEELVFGSEEVRCPECSSKDAERQLSTFSVRGESSPQEFECPPQGACGSCGDPRGPGACAMDN
ncbi:MAG: zinc ribbon domain-containing protein [Planctomycetes bacterium]|nr:zinc ribbon domain-containing protein [Planctomycetota bacterium]